MKNIILIFIAISLSSCSVTELYQVYSTANSNSIPDKDGIKFENEHCIMTYNLWANSGNSGFTLYNKSSEDLVVDLSKSFYISNGTSYEYFQNRKVGKSRSLMNSGTLLFSDRFYNTNENATSSRAATVTKGSSASTYVEYQEKQFITIPAKSFVFISEFAIVSVPYRSCEFPRNKTKNSIGSAKFTEQDSPIVFTNILSYSKGQENHRISNTFYVNEIANYTLNDITFMKKKTDCGKPIVQPYRVFTNPDPDKFYLRYSLR